MKKKVSPNCSYTQHLEVNFYKSEKIKIFVNLISVMSCCSFRYSFSLFEKGASTLEKPVLIKLLTRKICCCTLFYTALLFHNYYLVCA